ncbi:hypothetical protein [Paenibacillus sp. RC84]|uniref:hypothetical protein n=1 Tax=Paenibacillus sp. RC84 TaxID=3156252 RepID=UPI00351423C6
MKKSLVTFVLAGVLSLVGVSEAFAANQYEYASLTNNQNGATNYVVGQHAYGRWTLQVTSGTVKAHLYESCPGYPSFMYLESLTVTAASGKSAEKSSDYYMSGGCAYQVEVNNVENSAVSSKIHIRNYK